MRVGILLTCGKHLHDSIISPRGEVWVHKTIVYVVKVHIYIPSRESEHSCNCWVRNINFASFYDFDIWFWNCSDSMVFFGFHIFAKSLQQILTIKVTFADFGNSGCTLFFTFTNTSRLFGFPMAIFCLPGRTLWRLFKNTSCALS